MHDSLNKGNRSYTCEDFSFHSTGYRQESKNFFHMTIMELKSYWDKMEIKFERDSIKAKLKSERIQTQIEKK